MMVNIFNILLLDKTSILFRTIPRAVCKIQLTKFERVKIESHKNWNLGLSLRFSGVGGGGGRQNLGRIFGSKINISPQRLRLSIRRQWFCCC